MRPKGLGNNNDGDDGEIVLVVGVVDVLTKLCLNNPQSDARCDVMRDFS